MRFYKETYLTNRIFYGLTAVILLFTLGYIYPVLQFVAVACLVVVAGLTIYDVVKTYSIKAPLSVHRDSTKLFSLFDENPVTIVLKNQTDDTWHLRIIDEIPAQFQTRDFQVLETVSEAEERKIRYEFKTN